MSNCICVLGMHGGGTSLVASILDALGVDMHPNPNAKIAIPRGVYPNYEDSAFRRINAKILHACGAMWRSPPDPNCVLSAIPQVQDNIETLLLTRTGLWGWKDPRTALTVELWHRFLPKPRYVVVKREISAIARSLVSRGGGPALEEWYPLIREHYSRIDQFIHAYSPTYFTVTYEDLVAKNKGTHDIIVSLAKFIGVAPYFSPEAAMKRIRTRDQSHNPRGRPRR